MIEVSSDTKFVFVDVAAQQAIDFLGLVAFA